MAHAKYIVLTDHLGNEFPLIFPKTVQHSDVAQKISFSDQVVSAGFLMTYTEEDEVKFKAYGDSISLNKKSRPEIDSELIKRAMTPEM